MRKIGSDTGSVDNIVQGKLVNEGRGLQQKRKGLFFDMISFWFDREE